jgi:N-acyl-D-amino-acid deacylase
MKHLDSSRAYYLQNLCIYDGLANPPIHGDILVCDGKIAKIGWVDSAAVPVDAIRLECGGLSASPGFIDIHSHSDRAIVLHPEAECLLKQGITTSVGGQCGGSAAGKATEPHYEQQYASAGIPLWEDFEGFLKAVQRAKPAVNLAMLFGHGDVRTQIVGASGRPLTSEEKSTMVDICRKHMALGAFGISSGLEYLPGRFADVDELAVASKAVKERDGIHACHMRNEGPELVESVQEAIAVAEKSKVRFEISHLKAVGEDNWGKLPGVLGMLDEAEARNVEISADVYPYFASSTELAIVMPDWSLADGKRAGMQLIMNDSDVRAKIAHESDVRTRKQGGWDKIVVLSVVNPENKWMEGLSIVEIASKSGKPPQEEALDILIQNSMQVGIIRHSMSESDLVAAMRHPRTCIVTDGSIGVESEGKIHPRSIGTYARFLGHFVREKKVLPMPEAIRRVTSLPAAKMRIHDRGLLREGLAADLVIFDPDKIADRSTYQDPWHFPDGIPGVFVNGKPAVWEGELTGIRSGELLKK